MCISTFVIKSRPKPTDHKATFGKRYASDDEETSRRKAFKQNLDWILRHNAEADQGKHTYRCAVNEYTDLTNEQFRARFSNPWLLRKLETVSAA